MNLRVRRLIDATPEEVWALLVRWERQAEWMPDVAWVRVVGAGREAGAIVEVRTKVFGVPATTDRLEVTAWEPPRRLVVRHTGLVSGSGEWLLEPVGERTGFTWTERLRLPPPVLGEAALLVYAPVQTAMLRRSARNLARLVGG